MTKINIGHGPSYTIPFDSLDLAYLGKYVQTPRSERLPLWTKQRLDGELEYCQVKIVTRGDNNEECYSETLDTYQCHICNKNVPKICYQKHNQSDQHETIKKIYQKILERLSKQIDVNAINTDEVIGKDFYYCNPCSKMVKIDNKNNHEGTEYHAKSVKDLNIANEFYKLILNEKVGDVNEEVLGEEIEPDNSNDQYYDVFDDSMEASSSIDSDDDILVQNSIQPLVPRPSIIEAKKESPKEAKKQTFEEYLKEMRKKYNLIVALPVVEGDFIWLRAQNGDKVKVSREHFHSYREITNNTYCQLCNMWISKDTRAHDITERHVLNIFRPINDKFARPYDTVSSHCVPCNVVILSDSKLHYVNDVHQKLIKTTLKPKTDKTLCEDCNLYIDTHNFAVHLTSKKHLTVLMQKHSIQDTGTKEIFCKICNVTIPKNALKFHIGTKLHVTRKANESIYTELCVKSNDSTEINNGGSNENNASTVIIDNKNEALVSGVKFSDPTFCDVCKVEIPGRGLKIHVDGKPHQTKLAKLTSANKNDVKPNRNKAEKGTKPGSCTNTVSSNSTNRIGDSVASSTMSSLTYYGIESEDEDSKIDGYYDLTEFVDKTRTKVRCKICSVYIDFVEKNIIEHMEGRNHIKMAYQHKLEAYKKLLLYAGNENADPLCLLCDVNVPNKEINIIEHMEGYNHEIALNESLKFNSITQESSEFICKCCNIRTTSFIEHINSRNHTLEFLNKRKIDRNEMRKYVYLGEKNSFSRPYRLLYKNLLKYNGIVKLDEVNHRCGNCQLNLSRVSEIDHVLGERHRSQMEEVNKLNSILERLESTDRVI